MTFMSIYQNYAFYVLWFVFISLIAFVFLNIKTIVKQFKGIKGKTWIILILIFLTGFSLRFLVFPHVHLMYIDEPWYLELAKNMNQKHNPVVCKYIDYNTEQCNAPTKPLGWPFLISIVFLIFGLNNYYALYLGSLIGSFSIILIFLLTYLIFKNQKIALWSSFLLALTPIYILWSNSAETNSTSVFFVMLTMLFFIIYAKNKQKSILILTILSLFFTALIRFENIILAAILFLVYIKLRKFNSKAAFWRFLNAYYASIFLIILIIMILGLFYSISILRPYSSTNIFNYYFLLFFFFLKIISFNYIYLPLAVLSLFLMNKKDYNGILYLIISFIFFFFLYLPLSFESRMALTPGIFVIILSAFSLEKLSNIFSKYIPIIRVFIILILLFLLGLNLSENYKKSFDGFMYSMSSIDFNNHKLETENVLQIKNIIPNNCYVISEFPIVLTSISNMKGLGTGVAVNNPNIIDNLIKKKECVYYYHDGYCTESILSPSLGSDRRCKKMLEIFDYELVKKFYIGEINHYLFKITGTS